MSAPKWYSESRGQHIELADMVDRNLRSAWLKLKRGEYRVPYEPEPDAEDPPSARSLMPYEVAEMEDAFQAEFRRRGLDESGNAPEPQP